MALDGGKKACGRVGKRGITVMRGIANLRSCGIKLSVSWNDQGLPVGKNKDKFSSYIGVLVRKSGSIAYENWPNVPSTLKDNIWSDVKSAFDVDENHKDWVLKEAGYLLRQFRTYLARFVKDKEGNIIDHPPAAYANIVKEDAWRAFVTRCTGESFKALSEANRRKATKPAYPYRASRTGYRGLEQKMLEEQPADSLMTSVSRHLLWKAARVNKEGVIDNENVQRLWEQMESLSQTSSQGEIEDSGRDDILGRVLNTPEHPGRVRGTGFGVSQKKLFPPGKRSRTPSQDLNAKIAKLEEHNASMQSQVIALQEQVALLMLMQATKEVERSRDDDVERSHDDDLDRPHDDDLDRPRAKDSCTSAAIPFPEVASQCDILLVSPHGDEDQGRPSFKKRKTKEDYALQGQGGPMTRSKAKKVK